MFGSALVCFEIGQVNQLLMSVVMVVAIIRAELHLEEASGLFFRKIIWFLTLRLRICDSIFCV